MPFYGHYVSSETGLTGCVREVLTAPAETLRFAPQLQVHCSLCKKSHGFKYLKNYQAETPTQHKQILAWAQKNKIETDITLPQR